VATSHTSTGTRYCTHPRRPAPACDRGHRRRKDCGDARGELVPIGVYGLAGDIVRLYQQRDDDEHEDEAARGWVLLS
jgi:hypothetical protein